MPSPSAAEEHLRLIRSLMERATIYRAIAAQAALIGGILSLVAGGLLAGKHDYFVTLLARAGVLAVNADLFGFLIKWTIVLVLAAAANFFYLYRNARSRHEPFISPGMRLALRAMTPALLCGLVFTSFCTRDGLPRGSALLYDMALPQAWMDFLRARLAFDRSFFSQVIGRSRVDLSAYRPGFAKNRCARVAARCS